MSTRNFLQALVLRYLAIIFLVGLLMGCGENSGNTSSSTTAASTPTSTVAPIGVQNDNAPPANAVQTVASRIPGLLYIQSGGFNCFPSLKPFTVVLAGGDQLQYDTGTIQQMSEYIDELLLANQSTANPIPTVPAELSLVSGAQGACQALLEITNLGNSSVQVSQINMQQVDSVRLNSYQYRTINVCSMPIHVQCPPPSGTGEGQALALNVPLGKGEVGKVFQAQNASPFILYPGYFAKVLLSVSPPATPPYNLIYTLVPEIIVNVQGQPTPFLLNELRTTFAFANAQQFTCYGLQGNTFIPLSQNGLSYVPWCF
ncbi:MAG: hypothetical protein PVS3B3_37660 [Ktedonobacteraceae bacterium]